MKRFLALFLTACLLLGSIAMTAFATDDDDILDVVEPGADSGDAPASREDMDAYDDDDDEDTSANGTSSLWNDTDGEDEDTSDSKQDSKSDEETEETRGWRNDDQCGEKLLWNLEDGVLTIRGTGAMDNYTNDNPPWHSQRTKIKSVVLTGGVTTIGANAFTNYDSITSVDFGDSLVELGAKSFSFCDGITELTMPSSFKNFAEECLSHCSELKTITCKGGMPHFRLNCVWDTYATIVYPANNPWPLSSIQELEDAFHGRIDFVDSDGKDAYVREESQEVTFPTTAVTEPLADEDEDAPETEPAAVIDVTEPETEPEITQPETVTFATEETMLMAEQTESAPEKTASTRSGGALGLIIVIFILSGICLGALIFRVVEARRYRED